MMEVAAESRYEGESTLVEVVKMMNIFGYVVARIETNYFDIEKGIYTSYNFIFKKISL